ncbi:uroporphyrinogen-III C-methyltransferase [Halopseudomonas xiamenensis]|uniref:uroporphyrinogen-III C-methyltransferase n=1 Tax=Halopseudomonas xiamenensis TaxID=157792 RepID=UPI0016297EC0|nr:uroporphyrinogen-III C-methyltransferase [Halopseudomonas xiamenensis]
MEPTKDNNQQNANPPATDAVPTASATAAQQTGDKPADKAAGSSGTPPPRVPPAKARKTTGGGRGVGLLALLVAAAALGLSGWQWYQTQQSGQAQQQQLENRLTELANTQRQNQSSAEQRLQGLPVAEEWQQLQRLTADLQRSQQALSQRLDTLQGDARADWKLAEAEYLLRLASLRLLAAQDVASARELLEAVDDILQTQPDSGVFAVREQLARYQTQLEALPLVDRSGLFLKLAALHDQVAELVALPVPVFDPDEVTPEEEFEDRLARRTRGERMLMRLERYVRVDFQRGKVITPLLDEAEMQRVRRTLQLTLEQAQWAVLRGEGEIYRDSLERAGGMLEQFFELDNPQVRAVQSRLMQLAGERVSVTAPDLAPLQQGLAAYMQSRKSPAASGESADE